MKLIYTWIEKYMNLEKIGLSWDNEFKVEFSQNKQIINIEKKDDYIKLFPEHIQNIVAIVGKNGVGKSNILNLLSNNIKSFCRSKKDEKIGFFNLYYLDNNLYVIEGVGLHIIKNILEIKTNSKEYFSVIIENLNGKILPKHFNYQEKIEKKTKIAHLRYISREDERQNNEENISSDVFDRYLVDKKKSKHFSKYLLIDSINKSKHNFQQIFFKEKDIYLSITKNNKNFYYDIPQLEFKVESINILEASDAIEKNHQRDFIVDWLERSTLKLFHNVVINSINEIKKYKNLADDSIYEIEESKKLISHINHIQLEDEQEYQYFIEIYSFLLTEFKKLKKIRYDDAELSLEAMKELVEVLNQIPLIAFQNEEQIHLNLSMSDHITRITKIVDRYDTNYLNYLDSIILGFMPFSTGEQELIDLFSTIYHGLHLENVANHEHIVLILDEPNNFMHPEWSRRLINFLIEFLKDMHYFLESSEQLDNPNLYKYTIIFATHSPFMISDLSKNHVIALEIVQENNNMITIKEDMKKTFASNIHTLFSDSFFMEITIGEFARNKIDSMIKRLNEVNLNNNKKLSAFEKKEFNYIIDCIGEPLISIKLNEMYLKAIENDKELRKNLLEENIKKLQNELQRLDENDKNL